MGKSNMVFNLPSINFDGKNTFIILKTSYLVSSYIFFKIILSDLVQQGPNISGRTLTVDFLEYFTAPKISAEIFRELFLSYHRPWFLAIFGVIEILELYGTPLLRTSATVKWWMRYLKKLKEHSSFKNLEPTGHYHIVVTCQYRHNSTSRHFCGSFTSRFY